MTFRALLLVASLLAATPAFADPRIMAHFYQPSEVVTIHGRTDTQSTIAFAPDERIENVAVGDSAAWQVTPNKRADLLFLKPMREHARTNMTVVTDQRTYLFDLVSTPRLGAIYMLRFTYPATPKIAVPPTPAATVPVAVAEKEPEKPAMPDPSTLNFAWVRHGDKALLPTRLFDDGHSTYLLWPAEATLPAILTREPNRSEGPVNYTVHGDYIVVEGVPSQLVLRIGKQMASLTQAARPAPVGGGPTAPGRRADMAPRTARADLPRATYASSEP